MTAITTAMCHQGLFALGNITRLRDLSLAHCSQITDLGVQKFSQLCTELERINLTDCHVRANAIVFVI